MLKEVEGLRGIVRKVLLFVIPLLLLPLTLALFAFALPPQYSDTFLGGFLDKLDTFKEAQGRRVILAGGSGAAFAVRSDLLEQELPGFRAVNLGMYAGLGSTVPLDAVKDGLREGDVVVFLPEMSEQTLSLYFGAEAMWQATDGHWDMLRRLNPEQQKAMLAQFPYFAAQKAGFYFKGTRPQGDGIYTRTSFNRWGDIESDLRSHNTMPGGFDPDQPVDFSTLQPDESFLLYLNNYAHQCEEIGARFFFAFSPANSAAADASGAEAFTQALKDRLDCDTLGAATESLLEPGWFFDTNYHLNSAGAVVYTAKLASWLKGALGMETDTSIPLPEMPTHETETGIDGDDADASCFLYTDTEDGLRITGLSPKGKEASRLTLPAKAQGKPVLGFDAAVFAGNKTLKTLTIQPNIHHIPDGAFDGCDRLQEIIMRHIRPSECTVSGGLLRGTDAWILVDAEWEPAYKTDYFWAVHAARVRAINEKPEAAEPASAASPLPATESTGICFDGNGGCRPDDGNTTFLEAPISQTHLRTNAPDALAFTRPGYVLIGWNTAPDGSGVMTGPGSRFDARPGMALYAQWMQETSKACFTWQEEEGAAWVTRYSGTEETCVLPSSLAGLPVRGIRANAFQNAAMEILVIPPTIAVIEPFAFSGCSVHTLYLYDTLETVSDDSFSDCKQLKTLHVDAASPPVYSVSYYAAFADKYDWLLSLAGQKKLALFSGSSTRYGYDSEALRRAYPDYQPANMGVYAYTNALPQMDLILRCMEPEDVLLHAPEFDCLNFQTCENNLLDFHFWAMMEANYDCASLLDISAYSRVFDSLQQYLSIRKGLPARSWEESPNGYDDDGNFMNMPTYNQYGDFIMLRANNKMDVMLKFVRPEYTPAPFTDARLDSLNAAYQRFLDRGIQVLFTYTPRNRSSISEDSTPENRKALDRLLRERLCVPVISDMEDSLISGVYFFVIDSHLSSEGVRLHTLQIIDDLRPYLQAQ